jgi:LemA protein
MVFIVLLLLFLFVVLIWFVKTYNRLQRLANDVKRTKANIMASTQKKLDLASRLMDIAKAYGDHEKLTQVASAQQVSSIGDAIASARTADRVIGQVSSLAMAYPDLKANATYQQLMQQLQLIEGDLQQRREEYNGSASKYNSYRSSLPQCFIAQPMGFMEAPFYQGSAAGEDGVGDFKTDDGKMFRETFAKIGQRAGDLGARATRHIESAVADIRSGISAPRPSSSIESKPAFKSSEALPAPESRPENTSPPATQTPGEMT